MFAEFLRLAWILQSRKRRQPVAFDELEWSGTVEPKVAMLIVLFGVIIALSHLSAEQVERIRERMASRRWRKSGPVTDEI